MSPPRPPMPLRLRPGYHLVPVDGTWLLYRPDGVFVRLRLPSTLLEQLVAALVAPAPEAEVAPPEAEVEAPQADAATASDPGAEPSSELAAVLERFAAEGIVEPADGGSGPAASPPRTAVEGRGPVAELLVELLRAGGLPVAATPAPAPVEVPADVELVISCAGWIPDARWRRLDRVCAEQGTAWHRMYCEGDRFHLGPFRLPDDPRTVRYADARDRRLAADAHPEGLEAYWRYLDAGAGVPPPTPPTPAEAALVAGALASDVLAWAGGATPPSHGHQLAYERSTGRWRRHPVLPVPRGLMTEGIP